MSNKTRLLLCFLIYFSCVTFGQVSSAVDTITLIPDDNKIQLQHSFIIISSVTATQDSKEISIDMVEPILGLVTLKKTDPNFLLLISYDYLTESLPIKVGPQWKMLPPLDFSNNNEFSMMDLKSELKEKSESNLFTSGHIFRQLSLSPLGGSDFTGGLQMQLNGRLSDNLMVSGILTDQDFPIQPEGVTRELEDLDKVYITVTHPSYEINAGDILYKHNNINRKLVGLKNNFNINGWSGSSVYGGSKGTFSTLEMKGRDGDQGPYQLLGKNGNRDIIVLSGTEKVWVDGQDLIRGHNHDYTIDYSLGEIRFTPKILIHSDTDIFIEYEYSDFQYQSGFSGGNLTKNFGKSGKLNFGFYRELDQFQKSDWSNDIQDSLSQTSNGEIRISTVIIDEDGDYKLSGDEYVYSPDKIMDNSIRYSVTFEFDKDGQYSRELSDKGQIYYQIISDHLNQSVFVDTYSPFRTISAPKSQSFGFVDSEIQLGEFVSIHAKILGSGIDNNAINSSMNSENGFSHQLKVSIDSMGIGPGMLHFSVSDWNRDKSYSSLGQENDVRQTRLWNLDSSRNNGIRESRIKTIYSIQGIGKTNLELGRLLIGENHRDRTVYNQSITHPYFDESFFKYNSINKENGTFKRTEGRFQFNLAKVTPFISFLDEEVSEINRFNYSGGGLNLKFKDKRIESGISNRMDEDWSQESKWKKVSQDFVGFLNYSSQSLKGWNQRIIYQKRLKSINANSTSHDYSLAKINLSYARANKPIRWDTQFRMEESYSEERGIVYDSVGAGLGNYRYDPVFNTYISDPNGAYISYTVSTGKRNPNTVMEGTQKLEIDFGKISGFPNVLIRGNTRFDLRGKQSTLNQLLNPTLTDSTLTRSYSESRLEMIYNGKRRILSWIENRNSLNGMDPRGNDLDRQLKVGLEIDQRITKSLSLKHKGYYRTKEVESSVSSLRNRNINGHWNEATFQIRFNQSLDIDLGILGGFDTGYQQNSYFNANAVGFKVDGRFFFNKTGRIQSGIIWAQSNEKDDAEFLPPEALNGFPIGRSFRSNTRIQYFLNQSVSMIFSMTSINDDRYDNFITMTGEVRAHF